MTHRGSAADAIAPAFRHMQALLFRPFDLGRWFVLGFLSFLIILGQGGEWNGLRVGELAPTTEEERAPLRDAAAWVAENLTFVVVAGFVVATFLLCLVILFRWLSARATFCYLDSVATGRVAVIRPWKEHGRLADSYFFWRLVFGVCALIVMLAIVTPVVVVAYLALDGGGDIPPDRVPYILGVGLFTLPFLLAAVFGTILVSVTLFDFVAPIQRKNGLRCAPALREVRRLVRSAPGAFALYFLFRFVFFVGFVCAVFVIGCSTLCVGFCCMALPVIGQMVQQPYYAFARAFSLHFLRGFGPDYDLLAEAVDAPQPPSASPPVPASPAADESEPQHDSPARPADAGSEPEAAAPGAAFTDPPPVEPPSPESEGQTS